ncbi:DEAD/DEAH box helicase [Sphingopyxis granuli]|uniref:Superfamily I DNA/RNA helicase n=1 Tax=Sphingopyxis granuli TaxID=267128 RepID=A0AA86L463_9SPHN|nr:AAA domain-containing protein [Sphingopyxis granuli]AMG75203.1 Superfamily I DNA/RNA helicase [Sphingopyxis granuli]
MAITRVAIQGALEAERSFVQKGGRVEVKSADWEDGYLVLVVRSIKGQRRVVIDEALEGVRAKWGDELEAGGLIKLVDSDNDRIVIQVAAGGMPLIGSQVWLFPGDFLGPLIDMWAGEMGTLAAKRLRQTKEETEPLQPILPLGDLFADLRERQVRAVQSSAFRSSIIIGPPGTGKTYTIGALGAYLLKRFPKSRILLLGPTNVAVDTALVSIDDWLQRTAKQEIAKKAKRVGAYFDPRKFVDRPHLLAPGIAEKGAEFLLLEASEPPKSKVGEHIRWKDKLSALRKELGADISSVASQSRLVATTVSSAITWNETFREAGPWHFVICDEASQVIGPAALMVPAMGQQTIFAGDPCQLSPIVQCDEAREKTLLAKTAFDLFAHARTTMLNEQSRMAVGICQAVSTTFYDGELKVCRKALADPEWKTQRSPFFVDGREIPRVCFDQVSEPATYSQNYGGFIRFQSAKLIETIIDNLAGSYVDPQDILVLTPFRAQRTLIRNFLKRRHPEISVSTVHRAQGSERTLVIFDPVDGTSSFLKGRDGERLINVAISRAKAHVIVPFVRDDLENSALSLLHKIASKSFQTAGNFAHPFTFSSLAN